MDYKVTAPDAVNVEIWKEETKYSVTGGFTLDKTNLPASLTELPKGCMLNINNTTRVAKLVKSCEIYENAGATATDYKVTKRNALKVGDILAKTVGGKAYAITVIDKSNSAYDVVTVGTTLTAMTVGDVLFVSSAAGATAGAEDLQAHAMNEFEVSLSGTPHVTATIAALEVKEAKLPYPVHAANKTSLTSRFYFV